MTNGRSTRGAPARRPPFSGGSVLLAAGLLAGAGGLVYVAASTRTTSTPLGAAASTGSTPPDVGEPASPTVPQGDHATLPSAAHDTRPPAGDVLSHFHEALADLAAHARGDHVRILFFGDSHAQGEAWPGALRHALAKRFGDGGPGFVYAGLRAHRNDEVSCTFDGDFIERPKSPSSAVRDSDGIFGLGGVLTACDHGTAHVSITPRHRGRIMWDVCVRIQSSHGDATVTPVGGSASTITAVAATPLLHRTFASAPPGELAIDLSGDAELCGIVGERDPKDGPGVVLDTLGIVGARVATALSWDEATFRSEVARRKPDLVVLEYGTNESAEKHLTPDTYAANMRALIDRVHAARPDASCLVIGPTEIEAHPDAVLEASPAFQAAAESRGCAFWDPYKAMGGAGAMKRWRTESPPRAQHDGIHLTEAGYAELGKQLYTDLTAGI